MTNSVQLRGKLVEDSTPIAKRDTGAVLGLRFRMQYSTGEGRGFISVTAWDPALAAISAGHNVLVEGTLDFDQWETNGEKRQAVTLKAEAIHVATMTPPVAA